MEEETIIIVSVFSAAIALLLLLVVVLFVQVSRLRKRLDDVCATGRLRVQKLTMDDKNHAFHNPAISPDEELARRGFSMYAGDDVESGRGSERQTGGEFVEELSRELDTRRRQQPEKQQQQRREQHQQEQQQQQPPPFLLQSIQESKRRSRSLANPVANGGRQSDTNPNFIY